MTPTEPNRLFPGVVLVAAPHMDDEVLGCGGTLARLDDKARIHIVFATDGAKSPVPVLPGQHATAPDLASIRRHEAKSALQVLDIDPENISFLNFPDARLRSYHAHLRLVLCDLIREIQPRHVLVPFRYDRHPDHLALYRAMRQAVQESGQTPDLFEYFVYYRWQLLPGKDVRAYIGREHLARVDVAGVAERKREALECYQSQTTQFFSWQRRPILPPARVREVSQEPEYYLRHDPSAPGAHIFTRARTPIRLIHRIEPMLKTVKETAKELVISLLSR